MGFMSRLLGVDTFQSAKAANYLGVGTFETTGGYTDLPVQRPSGSFTTAWSNGATLLDPGESLTNYMVGGAANVDKIWRTQPNVRKVVEFIARNVASIPYKGYDRRSDTDRQPLKGDHPVSAFLKQPQDNKIPYRFWHAMVSDGLLYDRWCALKVVSPKDGAFKLVRIPAKRVAFIADDLEQVQYVKVYVGGDKQWREFSLDEVVFDYGYTPTGAGGLSPLHTLADLLAENSEAVAYRRQVWANGARVPSWISRPLEAPEWEAAERDRFRTQLHSEYSGGGPWAGSPLLLEDAMEMHESKAYSSRDNQDIEGRKLTAIEVCSAFFIPPELVGAREGTYSNVKEYRQRLYVDSLGPYIVPFEQVMNQMVVPDLNPNPRKTVYIEANIESKLRGSFEEQAAVMQTATGAPWMTRNEARAMQNRPPIKGGDELITPLNVLVGDQASPTDSGDQNEVPSTVKPDEQKSGVARIKSIPALSKSFASVTKKFTKDVEAFQRRQQASVLSALGAKAAVPLQDNWNKERWDKELTEIVAKNMKRTAGLGAAEVMSQVDDEDAEFDPDVMDGWLEKAADTFATTYNNSTYSKLAECMTEEDWKEKAKEVFEAAASVRAGVMAKSATTQAAGFGRQEAAGKVKMTYKTWVVNSSNPRPEHASMDGETVLVHEEFSNGARFPGDNALPTEEQANCDCSVEFTKED